MLNEIKRQLRERKTEGKSSCKRTSNGKLQQEKDLHLAKRNQEKVVQMEKVKLELEILKHNEIDKQREHELKKLEVGLKLKRKWSLNEQLQIWNLR